VNIPTMKIRPECSDEHSQRAAKAEALAQDREQAHRQAQAAQRFEASQVPARHRQRLGDESLMEHEGWRRKLSSIGELVGTGFLVALTGDRGRGKTQLAARLIESQTQHGTARYATAMDVFMHIKAGFSDKRSELDSLKPFQSVDLLVIDEAHDRGETEWEQRVLTHLIDCRYREMRDTLLVTNQKPGDFLRAIGASAASRITETGGVIECDWESFRSKK